MAASLWLECPCLGVGIQVTRMNFGKHQSLAFSKSDATRGSPKGLFHVGPLLLIPQENEYLGVLTSPV